jgi:hypothetical protein
LNNDVSTERESAGSGAEVCVACISIVALFPCIELSVPTVFIRFELAGCGTTIARDNVPIIAFLAVHRLKNAVTAARQHFDQTCGRTIISICRVPVITLFARLHSAVTADGRLRLAERVASISCSRIAVITLLIALRVDDAITTGRHFARRTATIGKSIMIEWSLIACFSLINHIIAAARILAGETTAIRQEVAPVVASVTLFAAILNIIPATRESAVRPTHVGRGVVVTWKAVPAGTEVALFGILSSAVPTDERDFNLA